MNILIDTHIAIWSLINHKKLNNDFISIIENLNNKIYVSLMSIWEVAIKNAKHGYKKMPLDAKEFIELCEKAEYNILPIKTNHILNIRKLKIKNKQLTHKDLFDKLLVSQSICENLTLYTRDTILLNYDVQNIKIV